MEPDRLPSQQKFPKEEKKKVKSRGKTDSRHVMHKVDFGEAPGLTSRAAVPGAWGWLVARASDHAHAGEFLEERRWRRGGG